MISYPNVEFLFHDYFAIEKPVLAPYHFCPDRLGFGIRKAYISVQAYLSTLPYVFP